MTEPASINVACRDCGLYRLCLPEGIDPPEVEALERIIQRGRPLKRNEHLFHGGSPFRSLYAVRAGGIKTYTTGEDGREQVTGFHLPGELLGLDAIDDGAHPCSARALETTSVCEIPFTALAALSETIPALHRQLLRVMSKELLREQSLLVLLGKRNADERLAAFLVMLSERYRRRNLSGHAFRLSMSRNDIAEYLGLAVETVSRLFSRFQQEGTLQVRCKEVHILDMPQLRALAGGGPAPEQAGIGA